MSRVRVVPWVLAFALVAMPSVMCVLGATVTPSGPTCVMPMDDDSGGVLQEGCCAAERSDLISLASSVAPDPSPSTAPVVVSLSTPESVSPPRLAVSFATDPLATSSRPTYLLVSAFRI